MKNKENNSILRCAVYIRVSTSEQAMYGKSLQAQREFLENYAAEHGMIVVDVYADEGQTARKELKKRKEIHRLLRDVESGKIDVIIFWKMDRWFRSVSDFYKVQDILDANRVTWIAVAEPNMNMETRDGRLNLNIMLSIGQNEVDTTSERIKFTVNNSIKNGRAVWGDANLPIGYMVQEVNGRKVVVKKPDEEEMVNAFFDYFKKHQKKRQTVDYMQKNWIPGFTYVMLRTMLSSEFYIGKYRDNTNFCPAYLTLEEWNCIQEISKRNIRRPPSGRVYLFSGLIRCPSCNRLLSGRGGSSVVNRKTGEKRTYCYYRCSKAHLDHCCTFKLNVSQNLIESYMINNLAHSYNGYRIRCAQVTEVQKRSAGKRSAEKISEEIERLNILFQKGRISLNYYDQQYSALEDELRNASPTPASKKDFTKIETILKQDVNLVYHSLTSENKQAFWRNIIEQIRIDAKGNVTEVDFL